MSQRNDLALKRRVLVDGNEWPDLVGVSGLKFERNTIEVPEFSKIRSIQNGVTKVPTLDIKWKVSKNSSVLPAAQSWYFNNETHDITIIDTDATGQPFQQYLCYSCELTNYEEPEYRAESPDYAWLTLHVLPYDVVPVSV